MESAQRGLFACAQRPECRVTGTKDEEKLGGWRPKEDGAWSGGGDGWSWGAQERSMGRIGGDASGEAGQLRRDSFPHWSCFRLFKSLFILLVSSVIVLKDRSPCSLLTGLRLPVLRLCEPHSQAWL